MSAPVGHPDGIVIKAGADYVYRLELREKPAPGGLPGTGPVIPLTGDTFAAKVARAEGQPALAVAITVDMAEAAAGVVEFRMVPAETRKLPREAWFEVAWTRGSPARTIVIVGEDVTVRPETV